MRKPPEAKLHQHHENLNSSASIAAACAANAFLRALWKNEWRHLHAARNAVMKQKRDIQQSISDPFCWQSFFHLLVLRVSALCCMCVLAGGGIKSFIFGELSALMELVLLYYYKLYGSRTHSLFHCPILCISAPTTWGKSFGNSKLFCFGPLFKQYRLENVSFLLQTITQWLLCPCNYFILNVNFLPSIIFINGEWNTKLFSPPF